MRLFQVLLFSCGIAQTVVSAPPSITYFSPAGAQRGTTVEVTAVGSVDTSTKWWANDPSLSVEAGKSRGKLSVKVAADAKPGTYWLRAYNADGASSLRPFIVGLLPEILEKEPNDEFKKPQFLDSSSVVVNGQLAKPGDVDCFSISAKKGQTLVASMEAHRTLRSPMDGVLQIVSPDGFVLDQNNDYHGLDPQVAYAAPKVGTYIVRLFAFPASPDTTIRFAGGETYAYRLTITTGGFLDHTIPLAAGPSIKAVEAHGWNISDDTRRIELPAVKPFESHLTVFHPKLAGAFRIRNEKHTIAAGSEPFAPPFSSTHQFAKANEEIAVHFLGKKGQPLSIQAESRSLGLAADPVVRVLDKEKKQLIRAEPPKLASDTVLSFTPPADSEYTIAVSDLYGGAGPRYAFLLRVTIPEPDYDLAIAGDRFAIPPGKPLDIPVKITRKNGFAKAIEIVAEGLPEGVKWEVKPPAGKADPNQVTIAALRGKDGALGRVSTGRQSEG